VHLVRIRGFLVDIGVGGRHRSIYVSGVLRLGQVGRDRRRGGVERAFYGIHYAHKAT
jgi:hypothetical protein